MVSKRVLAVAVAIAAGFGAGGALAQEQVTLVSNTYRTGAFAGSGIPIADGMRDLVSMINARDGGVNGVKIVFEECETGYDTKKSIECYEQARAKGSVMYLPWSTGATLAAIPRAHIDKMPVMSMAYGLSASANGETFPWIFNPPLTYWDGASIAVRYFASKEGGFDKLKGKTIGLVHLDAPYGKEPIPVLEALAKEYGFSLKLYPVAPTELQNQSSLWLSIRRDRPDWIYLQGWGAMSPTAVREAGRAGFPVDKVLGVWWSGGDDDARPAGPAGKGYKSLSWHQVGTSFPLLQDVIKHVVDKGQSLSPKEKVGDSLYNRGLYQGVLFVEALRNAQKLTGKKVVNSEDMRRGLEALDISVARWKELGAEGFAAPVKVTCANHNGHNDAFILEWDGTKWQKGSDWLKPLSEKVQPLIEQAAKDYATQNSGWPKRAEACDQRS